MTLSSDSVKQIRHRRLGSPTINETTSFRLEDEIRGWKSKSTLLHTPTSGESATQGVSATGDAASPHNLMLTGTGS